MLTKVSIKDGFITNVNGKVVEPCMNIDVHTWNIKIENGVVRCKTFSGAVGDRHRVTRFSLQNSTIYLVNKINTAYCYQRSEMIENFLIANDINVVKCMEKEGLTINDGKFSQLDDGKFVRYEERIFISPSNVWAIVSDVDTEFTELWINKESDFKRFFRDPEILKEIEAEFHCVNWNNWNIPEEYSIKAKPENNGLYVSKIDRNFIVAYSAGHVGLMPNHFDFAIFNGIGDKYYRQALLEIPNLKISEFRDFYFNPPVGESIQRFYAIDSRYWEKQ